jgi:hypothetical protein
MVFRALTLLIKKVHGDVTADLSFIGYWILITKTESRGQVKKAGPIVAPVPASSFNHKPF